MNRLREGDSDDIRGQLAVEDALDDLARYVRLHNELADVAADLETYGRRSRHDVLQDLAKAHGGNQEARNRIAAHRRASAS